jgi:hypothetical protein
MTKVMRNDGSWSAKPSGLKKGNLSAWRQMMFDARPEPEVDDIIVDKTTSGEIIGYLCTVADGYDSYWKRVAKAIDVPKIGGAQQQSGGWGQPQQPANVFYTQRAQEALNQEAQNKQPLYAPQRAQPQYNEPPMDSDADIPF